MKRKHKFKKAVEAIYGSGSKDLIQSVHNVCNWAEVKIPGQWSKWLEKAVLLENEHLEKAAQ